MAGHYLNKTLISKYLNEWITKATQTNNSWENNNLHIDEIETFNEMERETWVTSSLEVFNILINMQIKQPFMFFLHIDLSDSLNMYSPDLITLEWINDNIDEFTPPSFNCTISDYFKDFYVPEFLECSFEKKLFSSFIDENKIKIYYRTILNVRENCYSRELYIFHKDN